MVTEKLLRGSFRRSTTAVKRLRPRTVVWRTLTRFPATRIVAETTGSRRWVTTWMVNFRRLTHCFADFTGAMRFGVALAAVCGVTCDRQSWLPLQSDAVAGRTVIWKTP